jgi:hypothetical protein
VCWDLSDPCMLQVPFRGSNTSAIIDSKVHIVDITTSEMYSCTSVNEVVIKIK